LVERVARDRDKSWDVMSGLEALLKNHPPMKGDIELVYSALAPLNIRRRTSHVLRMMVFVTYVERFG